MDAFECVGGIYDEIELFLSPSNLLVLRVRILGGSLALWFTFPSEESAYLLGIRERSEQDFQAICTMLGSLCQAFARLQLDCITATVRHVSTGVALFTSVSEGLIALRRQTYELEQVSRTAQDTRSDRRDQAGFLRYLVDASHRWRP